jgi:hypothetical protein
MFTMGVYEGSNTTSSLCSLAQTQQSHALPLGKMPMLIMLVIVLTEIMSVI